MNTAVAFFIVFCSAISIACSLATLVFTKASSDYRGGRWDTRAVAFHQWTERVVERCKR